MKKKLKKLFNIILSLCLFLQNFAFINVGQVFADDIQISIGGITQNNKSLQKEGDVYVANELGEISVKVNLTPYVPSFSYYVKIYNGDKNKYSRNSDNCYIEPPIDYSKEINEYEIKVCEYYDCEEPIATLPFKVKFTQYEQLANTLIYVTKVMQNGHEIEPDEWGYYNYNDVQDVTVSIKGENLLANKDYTISYLGYENIEYKGSELAAGIDYTFTPGEYTFDVEYEIYGMNGDVLYWDGEEYRDVEFGYYNDPNVATFQADLMYTNYKNTSLDVFDRSWYDDITIIRKAFHNSYNSLSYRIEGINYDDSELYPVNIIVYGDDENKVYDRTYNLYGSAINNGYDLELTGLNLDDYSYGKYSFNVTIDGVKKSEKCAYDKYQINVKTVKQNENILEKENGVYQVPGFSDLIVDFDISGLDNTKDYYLIQESPNNGSSGTMYDPTNGDRIHLDLSNAETTYKFYLCDEFECNRFYGEGSMTVNLVNLEALNEGEITLTKVMQGGEEVELGNDGAFHFNRIQDVEFYFEGTNLMDDLDYRIAFNYSTSKIVKGSELEDGVVVKYNPYGKGYDLNYFSVNLYADDASLDNYCYNNGDKEVCSSNSYIDYLFDKIVSVPTYTGNIKYTNYPDVPVNNINLYGSSVFGLKTDYHDSNNSLTYVIDGADFEDKNYTVKVNILREGLEDFEEFFTKEYTVNGLLLNDGYDLELRGLTLDKKTSLDSIENMYKMEVTLAGVTQSSWYLYSSTGDAHRLSTLLSSNKDKINVLNPYDGYVTGEINYIVNEHIFDNNNKIDIDFVGDRFIADEHYSYKIQYGQMTKENDGIIIVYNNILEEGIISGSDLNKGELSISVGNPSGYDAPAYRIIVYKGDEVLRVSGIVLSLVEKPSLIDVQIKSGNKIVTENDNYDVFATKGKPLTMTLFGMGFENRDYEYNVCSTGYKAYYGDGEQECEKVTLAGSDINNGTATITINHDTSEYNSYSINIKSSSNELSNSFYLSVVYYDEDAIIISGGPFKVDEKNSIISDVSRTLEAKDVINSITFADGYSAKVYDSTGNTEVTGEVGTGMILKVFNSDNQVEDEYVLSVYGDLSGDGKTTITDVVKAKRHIEGTAVLTGAYLKAGDLSNSDDIGLTDLIRLARDVADIEEIW